MRTKATANSSEVSQVKNSSSKNSSMVSFELVSNEQPTHRTLIHQTAIEDIGMVETKMLSMKALHVKYASTYNSHRNMKARCIAMGIELAPQFERFIDFLAMVGPAPNTGDTIDRINPEGPYVPENVRWANKTVQARNRTNVRHLTFNGETLPLVAWAERLQVPASRLRGRLQNGWSDAEVITGTRTTSIAKKSEPDLSEHPFKWHHYVPWPKQDAELWERSYQLKAKQRSRLQFALQVAQENMKSIALETEEFPPPEVPRSVEMEKRERYLSERYAICSRAYIRASEICKKGLERSYANLPSSVEQKLRQLFSSTQ